MTYTPTKGELEEMGFWELNGGYTYITHNFNINLIMRDNRVAWSSLAKKITPTCKQDIETLIRLFTNPHSNGQK